MTRAVWGLTVLLSHWRRHPMQLATLMIGLICATALWSGVQALNQQARTSYDRAAALFGGNRTAMLVSPSGAAIPQQLYVNLRRAGWAVSPVLEARVTINSGSYRLIGIDPVTLPREATATGALPRSDIQALLTPPGRTLIARDTLAELGLTEGATPAISDTQTLPPLKPADAVAPGVLMVDIGVAQRVLNRPNELSRLLVGPPQGTARPLAEVAGTALQLNAADSASDLQRLTDSFHLNLTAFGLLSFLVGLFIVNSAVGLAFEQRRPTLRTMRACGLSVRMVGAVMILELVTLALIAGFIGLICGYLIAAALLPDVAASLRGLYGARVPGQLTLQPQWWIAGLAISVAGALIAAAASLWKAARMPLLATAQPFAWQQRQQRLLRWQGAAAAAIFAVALACTLFGDSLISGFAVLACLLIGAALALPVILGGVLALGERCTDRPILRWFWADNRMQLSGLSLALMALLLALAVNVGVGTMVQSFSRTFTVWLNGRLAADIYLQAESTHQADEIRAWLRTQPDVTAVLPNSRTEITLAGLPVELTGYVDHATYRNNWPLLDATPDAWDRKQQDGAFVSEQLARRLDLKLGDRLTLPTARGDWPLTVVAIYADYGNPRGQISTGNAALLTHFPNLPRVRMGLIVRGGATAQVMREITTRYGLAGANLADQATVKDESQRIFNRTFAVTGALNTFTLGIAGIALLTNLLTLGGARLPQLAPLWAIGLDRRSLAWIELAKTLAVAFLTALLALPLGLLVAWCLLAIVNVKAFGWRLPLYIFPMQLIELLGVAMLAALLASIIPIVRLMRMQPAGLVKVFANER